VSLICVPSLSSKFGGMIRSKGEDQPSSQITMNNSSQTPRAPSSGLILYRVLVGWIECSLLDIYCVKHHHYQLATKNYLVYMLLLL
jgi:hypothetical protein